MNKNTDKIKELISSYVDGYTNDEETKYIEDLIINQKEWQEYYKELKSLSVALEEWSDEQVSADMANKIQKTLLDEKLQEEHKMERKNHLKIGGGAFVTIAICVMVGALYLKLYSNQSQQEHVQRMADLYEPYYLSTNYSIPGDLKNVGDEIGEQLTPLETSEIRQNRLAGNKLNEESVTVELMNSDILGYDEMRNQGFSNTGKLDAQIAKTSSIDSDGYDLNGAYREGAKQKAGQSEGFIQAAKDKEAGRRVRGSGGFQQSTYDPSLGLVSGLGGASTQEYKSQDNRTESQSETTAFSGAGFYKREDIAYSTSKKMRLKKPSKNTEYNYPASSPSPVVRDQVVRRSIGNELYEAEEVDSLRGRHYTGFTQLDTYDDDYVDYPYRQPYNKPNSEEYASIYENPFLNPTGNPLSTFSIDVDTASYSNVRRFLEKGQMPPADSVRIEEMVNYFDYEYKKPRRGEAFSVTTNGGVCPWNPAHYLVMIGLQGNVPSERKIPPSNLVFLIDVSGSMNSSKKLPLLKRSLKMMVDQLRPDQKVAIVTYSGSARLVLDSTSGSYKGRIHAAIDNLRAGGSTAGEAGLKMAYRIARNNYIRHGNNRVILASDGDFNVGMQSDYELVELIKQRRNDGIFLSILGFGTGNLKDAKMEKIANNGNGNYNYIDSLAEGKKVLVDELGSTLFTIAKDVKIQVEFNPKNVKAYRLIGYENRLLNKEDFNNDRVDAGEIGAGHTVTALYEVIPTQNAYHFKGTPGVDALRYQKKSFGFNNELMTVKLRYKQPKANRSRLIKRVIRQKDIRSYVTGDLMFASAVAEFGMLLRNSRYKGYATYDHVITQARKSRGQDLQRHRAQFITMVERAKQLDYRHHQYPHPEPHPYPYYDDYPEQHVPQMQFK